MQPVSRVFALLVSAVSAFGAWLTWRAFVTTQTGQAVEEAALAGAEYGQTRLWRLAEQVLEVVSLSFVVIGVLIAIVIALMRRRWALAVQAAVLVIGANVATQALKRGFDRPAFGDGAEANTLPSGHTTVAASFAAALVLVAPRRLRPWLALLGAGYTAATGVSTLIGQWHRPSDAIAAVLVVVAWGSLICALGPRSAGDQTLPRRVPPDVRGDVPGTTGRQGDAGDLLLAGRLGAVTSRKYPSAAAGTAAVVGALVVGALLTGLPAAWSLAEAHEAARSGETIREVATYVGGALGVAAVSATAFMLFLLVRQATAKPRQE